MNLTSKLLIAAATSSMFFACSKKSGSSEPTTVSPNKTVASETKIEKIDQIEISADTIASENKEDTAEIIRKAIVEYSNSEEFKALKQGENAEVNPVTKTETEIVKIKLQKDNYTINIVLDTINEYSTKFTVRKDEAKNIEKKNIYNYLVMGSKLKTAGLNSKITSSSTRGVVQVIEKTEESVKPVSVVTLDQSCIDQIQQYVLSDENKTSEANLKLIAYKDAKEGDQDINLDLLVEGAEGVKNVLSINSSNFAATCKYEPVVTQEIPSVEAEQSASVEKVVPAEPVVSTETTEKL